MTNTQLEEGAAAKNHLSEQMVICRTKQPRETRVLNGMEQLGLVYVTAQGMTNAYISKRTQRAVQQECVGMEGQKVFQFRQLQNVDTPKQMKSEGKNKCD